MYIDLVDLVGEYFLEFVLLFDFGGQFEGSEIYFFEFVVILDLYVGFNIEIFE